MPQTLLLLWFPPLLPGLSHADQDMYNIVWELALGMWSDPGAQEEDSGNILDLVNKRAGVRGEGRSFVEQDPVL